MNHPVHIKYKLIFMKMDNVKYWKKKKGCRIQIWSFWDHLSDLPRTQIIWKWIVNLIKWYVEPSSRCSNTGGCSFPRGRLPPAVAVGRDDVVEAEGGGGRVSSPHSQQARRMVSRWDGVEFKDGHFSTPTQFLGIQGVSSGMRHGLVDFELMF